MGPQPTANRCAPMRFKSSSSSRRTLTAPREENPLVQQFIPLCLPRSATATLRLECRSHQGREGSSLSRSLLDISPSLRDPITFKWPEIERFRREREREERPVQDILGRRERGRVAPIVSSCPAYASLRRYSDVQIHCLDLSAFQGPLPHS